MFKMSFKKRKKKKKKKDRPSTPPPAEPTPSEILQEWFTKIGITLEQKFGEVQ
eukprot:CAMPEP_0185273594 /NCGR_PEP_ID=MMETSP1359-20130426/49909_1 /TAXON_ID=552665 /ORGANISM="Bigelowiella longifila, Strain CCMP242" /LENGTH=52 /DNA_ID=CAMNT_0027866281 /DNA_START=15 /DNA_END=170 /DNA_ORIENTATION=-